MDCDLNEKKWRVKRSSSELFTPPMYLTDIIHLPRRNPPLNISSLRSDYAEKGLSLRQIAAQKVHSRSKISETLKAAGVKIRASGHSHGNPSQLKFGYRKEVGKVIIHKGEKLIVEAIILQP